MVIGTNSLLTGIPSVGCGEEETIQCITAQLGYSTAVKTACCEVTRRSGPSPAGLLCSARLGCMPVCFALHWSAPFCGILLWPTLVGSTLPRGDIFAVSVQPGRCSQSSVFRGKAKYTLTARGELAYRDKIPIPVPDLSVFLQMRTPNHHSLMGPKGTILIDQNRTTLVVWIYAVLIEWGKPLSSWLEKDSGNSFIRTGSGDRNSAGRQLRQRQTVQCSPLPGVQCA